MSNPWRDLRAENHTVLDTWIGFEETSSGVGLGCLSLTKCHIIIAAIASVCWLLQTLSHLMSSATLNVGTIITMLLLVDQNTKA